MANQVLYGGFRRLGPFALDPDSVKLNIWELEQYIKNSRTIYNGQQIVVTNEEKKYDENGNLISDLNGVYTIIFPKDTKPGEIPENRDEIIFTQSANMAQVVEAIDAEVNNLSTTVMNVLNPLNQQVQKIERFVGFSEDENSNKGGIVGRVDDLETLLNGDSEENKGIIGKIAKLEELLKLINDDNSPDDILDGIRKNISDLSSDLSELSQDVIDFQNSLASNETITAIQDDITDIKDLLNKLDDGDPETEFQEYLEKIEELRKSIDEVLNPSTMTSFDVLLINSKHLKNLVYNIMESGEKDENGETADSKLPLIRKSIEDLKDLLKPLIDTNTASITDIKGSLATLQTDIDSRVKVEDYDKFKSKTISDIAGLKKNTQRMLSFEFNSENNWCKFPEDTVSVTITEARVVIETPSNEDEKSSNFMKCRLVIDGVDTLISDEEDCVYFDEVSEYIVEKTINLTSTSDKSIQIYGYGSGGHYSDFKGARGRIYITYYEN